MERVVICTDCGDPEACLRRFRTALIQMDMVVTLDSSLAALPGSVHLHLRPKGERTGTLEYTMDRLGRTAWLSWHANRYRPWIDEAVKRLSFLGCGT